MNRRVALFWVGSLATAVALSGCSDLSSAQQVSISTSPSVMADASASPAVASAEDVTTAMASSEETASAALADLPVKGRAPKTGYTRAQFGKAWTDANSALWGGDSLSTRENILSRDLTNIVCKVSRSAPILPPCVVQSGVLTDPYTGGVFKFVRGQQSSQLFPIDHVVALGDAWQKGAQQITAEQRVNLANDPLNLIATTRAPNSAKNDSDAASWLMPNKRFRCAYVARQIAVKGKYHLWVTQAEKEAMERVLAQCPDEPVATTAEASQRTVSP